MGENDRSSGNLQSISHRISWNMTQVYHYSQPIHFFDDCLSKFRQAIVEWWFTILILSHRRISPLKSDRKNISAMHLTIFSDSVENETLKRRTNYNESDAKWSEKAIITRVCCRNGLRSCTSPLIRKMISRRPNYWKWRVLIPLQSC